jgi:hypothetical protein
MCRFKISIHISTGEFVKFKSHSDVRFDGTRHFGVGAET